MLYYRNGEDVKFLKKLLKKFRHLKYKTNICLSFNSGTHYVLFAISNKLTRVSIAKIINLLKLLECEYEFIYK